METAGISLPGASGPSLGFEDYSVYTNLSDEELIQIAIERSLSGDHNKTPSSDTRPTPCTSTAEVSQYLHSTSAQPGDQNQSVATHSSSPNPPTSKPPDGGWVSHFTTGYGKRMVAYRNAAGNIVRVEPEEKEEEDPLLEAIKTGDANRVRKLVNLPGCNLVYSKSGWKPIHQAASYSQEACLRVLLTAQPCTVNQKTAKQETALMLAVCRQHAGCVRLLLERGANTELVNEDRESPLYKACERSNAELVAELLNHGAAVNTPSIRGWTALHEAVIQNNVEICQMLVKAGAKVNAGNIYGMTPLCTAAQCSGKFEAMHFLLKHGADINSQATDGSTALYEAAKNDHEDVVVFLLSLDADANIPGKRGLLPLHIAAQKGSTVMVTMMIPATSKARVRRTGISPLHLAAEHDHDDVLELLISAGFDPNAQLSEERSKLYEDHRSTALYFSVIKGNKEATSMLLEAGADPNLDLFPPLLVAVRQGCMQTVKLLLEHGANINAYIPFHHTSFPASILFSMKHLRMLKLLLDNGCDAQSCFACDHGNGPHPPIRSTRLERVLSDDTRDHCYQFCEMISLDSISQWAGPIIDVLLDYVGHVTFCSRLQEQLDSYPGWQSIKEKAVPPWRLMQLCRLKIRQQVGIQRLRDMETLPLPGTLIRFLQYQEASVDEPQESWEDTDAWS